MTSSDYDAVLFDLDGVLTSTAGLHARCWKAALDPVLAEWARSTGKPMAPFGAGDYLAHVDGRVREEAAQYRVGIGQNKQGLPPLRHEDHAEIDRLHVDLCAMAPRHFDQARMA